MDGPGLSKKHIHAKIEKSFRKSNNQYRCRDYVKQVEDIDSEKLAGFEHRKAMQRFFISGVFCLVLMERSGPHSREGSEHGWRSCNRKADPVEREVDIQVVQRQWLRIVSVVEELDVQNKPDSSSLLFRLSKPFSERAI